VRDGQADRGIDYSRAQCPSASCFFAWHLQAASITRATAQQMIVGGLIERDQVASR
jgi:hypothetical protein